MSGLPPTRTPSPFHTPPPSPRATGPPPPPLRITTSSHPGPKYSAEWSRPIQNEGGWSASDECVVCKQRLGTENLWKHTSNGIDHVFHRQCIDAAYTSRGYFGQQKKECPICRFGGFGRRKQRKRSKRRRSKYRRRSKSKRRRSRRKSKRTINRRHKVLKRTRTN